MADDKKEESKGEDEAKAGSSNMKIIIIAAVMALVISVVVIGAAFFLLGDKLRAPAEAGEAEEEVVEVEEEKQPALYRSLDPKFTVTFKNQEHARFMQFSVDVMTRDEDVIEPLKLHMPAIRSSLVLLFGVQEYEKMSTREGKELLLVEVAEDVNKTLELMIGKSGVEAAFFNSFLMQ